MRLEEPEPVANNLCKVLARQKQGLPPVRPPFLAAAANDGVRAVLLVPRR
jgi:hypothetical protein